MSPASWPTDWTRIPLMSRRNTALSNARAAAEECARRRYEREEADHAIAEAFARHGEQAHLGAVLRLRSS